MWLTIVLERHFLPGPNLKIRFNAPSPGFSTEWECITSRREFLWKNFYSARITFSPRLLSRFCIPAGFSTGPWRRAFFLAGSRLGSITSRCSGHERAAEIEPRSRWVEISLWDSCRDTRREFFPGRIPPGKRAISAGSRRNPGERRESWRDPGEIPVPILQGLIARIVNSVLYCSRKEHPPHVS